MFHLFVCLFAVELLLLLLFLFLYFSLPSLSLPPSTTICPSVRRFCSSIQYSTVCSECERVYDDVIYFFFTLSITIPIHEVCASGSVSVYTHTRYTLARATLRQWLRRLQLQLPLLLLLLWLCGCISTCYLTISILYSTCEYMYTCVYLMRM